MPRLKLIDEKTEAQKWLPESQPDGSRIGVSYADAYIKPMNKILEDDTKVTCKRRGLKISVQVGDNSGEALMRRLDNGPDVQDILQSALTDAFKQANVIYSVEDGTIYLDY